MSRIESRRSPLPHEKRDAWCSLVFTVAAMVALAHAAKGTFHSMFWSSSAIATIAWLTAYRKWTPVIVLLGMVAFRAGVYFVISRDLRSLVLALGTGGAFAAALWYRRNDR